MQNVKLLHDKAKKAHRPNHNKLYQQEINAAATSIRLPKQQYDPDLMYCDDHDIIDEILPNTSQEDHFSKLSDELILQIFCSIPKLTLLKYSVVCKRWNRLMYDESLWRFLDLSERNVNAEILLRILNRGVRVLCLARSDIRKSTKKRITNNEAHLKLLHNQLEMFLDANLRVQCLDLTSAILDLKSLNAILKNCKNLKKLSLEAQAINCETFEYLSANKSMVALNLCMCRGITADCIVLLLSSLKCLKSLNVSWVHLDRESVVLLCKHLPKTLNRLNLSGCKTTLLDDDIESLVNACPHLMELDVSDAQSLTSASVSLIGSNLAKIQYLAFSRCYSILPSSYLLLKNCKHLIALDLFNIIVKEKNIETLKSVITSLQYVNNFPFSSIARPMVKTNRAKIWGHRIRDI